MGLTSWTGANPKRSDAAVAKNYLAHDELDVLNRIVTSYLEFAELQALNRKPMYMKDWTSKLDDFLIPAPAQNQAQVGNYTGITNPSEVAHPTEVENTTPVVKAEVPYQTPASEQARVDSPTPVEIKTQVEDPAPVSNQTVVAIKTPVTKTTQVTDPTPAQNPTSVEKQTEVPVESRGAEDRATAMRRATEQDSSVVLEARAVDSLDKGYTRVPNTVLMKLASTDFTRNEIKLALLIARFTISFQRKHAPLSKTVLERRTGLRGPAVLEALSGLVAKGLVEKIQGDQHRPNQLGLVLPPDWDQPTKPGRETTETPVQKPTPVEKPPVGKPASTGDANQTGAGVGNPTNFKDIERYSKDTLSHLPENLRTYFDGLRLQRKRESEWQAFEELRAGYSAEDIADAFWQVAEKALPGGQRMPRNGRSFLEPKPLREALTGHRAAFRLGNPPTVRVRNSWSIRTKSKLSRSVTASSA